MSPQKAQPHPGTSSTSQPTSTRSGAGLTMEEMHSLREEVRHLREEVEQMFLERMGCGEGVDDVI